MPVAEIGKVYTYNGKKYVACEVKNRMTCVGCSLLTNRCEADRPVKMMRDGLPYTCLDRIKRDCVIFVEVKE